MEFSNIPLKEYNRDQVQTNLREIFEPNSYIAQRAEKTPFEDIKIRIQDMINNILGVEDLSLTNRLNDKFLELDFGSEFDIDATKIGINDAIFFVNLLNNQGILNYSVEGDNLNISDINNKNINVTKSLLNMLNTSFESKKPIRLDFDNDVTVILKLDKEGKIQAHFIPGTAEVEQYLKNNISCLKQTFDDEEIEYSYLGYSKNRDNKKDNDNENSKNKKRSNS